LSGEKVAREREPLPNFAVIIKFAVKDYANGVGFIPNGLMSAGEIDDAEAAHA
jgi:hypothetical protein